MGRESEEQRLPPFFEFLLRFAPLSRTIFQLFFLRILYLNVSVRASTEEKSVHLTLCLLRTRDVHSGVG